MKKIDYVVESERNALLGLRDDSPQERHKLAAHRTAFKNLKVLGSNPAPARGECSKKIDSVFESERSAWLGLRNDSPQGRHKLAAHRTVLKAWCKLWVATAGLMSLMAVQGGTVSWVGGSGDWSNTNNWSTGALPGANDDIIINPANTLALSGGSTLTNPTLGLGNNGTHRQRCHAQCRQHRPAVSASSRCKATPWSMSSPTSPSSAVRSWPQVPSRLTAAPSPS